jgi:hypothetical protein
MRNRARCHPLPSVRVDSTIEGKSCPTASDVRTSMRYGMSMISVGGRGAKVVRGTRVVGAPVVVGRAVVLVVVVVVPDVEAVAASNDGAPAPSPPHAASSASRQRRRARIGKEYHGAGPPPVA